MVDAEIKEKRSLLDWSTEELFAATAFFTIATASSLVALVAASATKHQGRNQQGD
jgi:hypothetical protein